MVRVIVLFAIVIACAGSTYSQDSVPVTQATDWSKVRDCTEFLPKQVPCKITIPMTNLSSNPPLAPGQADVTIQPGGTATVVLTNSSPLMSCALTSSPSALSRDATSSITTFLASIGGLGAIAAAAPAAPNEGAVPEYENSLPAVSIPHTPAIDDAKKIDKKLKSIQTDIKTLHDQYEIALHDYGAAKLVILGNWKYSYLNDASFAMAAKNLFAGIGKALEDPLPTSDDEKGLHKSVDSVEQSLEEFKTEYSDKTGQLDPPDCHEIPACIQKFESWLIAAQAESQRLNSSAKSMLESLPFQVQTLSDAQAALKPAYNWLSSISTPFASGTFTPDPKHPWTTVSLPMTQYAQKQVTEAVTCKDVLTQAQISDTTTFTAYYEIAPSWDLSAGAFISLVPGRQVGTVSGPLPAASMTLAVTSSSAVQFIPGAIFEIHPSRLYLNFVCPWARKEEGTGYHPWGYVCSFGPAVGFLINPNNGTASAEFFEGVSFGIHRLSILVGNHTGRFQEFTGGYQIGQVVPSGTMPPTTRIWTNHLAIGISYRIPLR
jgi:hypothetical protein